MNKLMKIKRTTSMKYQSDISNWSEVERSPVLYEMQKLKQCWEDIGAREGEGDSPYIYKIVGVL